MPEDKLKYFAYEHLPEPLKDMSMRFNAMAHIIYDNCPENPQRTIALQKLLEAKDCAVRSLLP